MTSVELDNLVRIGRLKREPAAATEIKGLIRSGELRLADAAKVSLSLESRFDLAYNAAHALGARGATAPWLSFRQPVAEADLADERRPHRGRSVLAGPRGRPGGGALQLHHR